MHINFSKSIERYNGQFNFHRGIENLKSWC